MLFFGYMMQLPHMLLLVGVEAEVLEAHVGDVMPKVIALEVKNLDLKTGNKIGTGHETGGLYYLDVKLSPTRALTSSSSSAYEWHCRLGHPSLSLLKLQVRNLGNVSPFPCEACQISKHHRVF
ncbi:hypothetical protein F2P56_009414 [Juglans regia]|uniref:GAG-pre-integrase domain-containing protein n=1 Tax=Juglans regia TaxID=51240 RepID=A0A834D011_JUGRE|nr:hypothetical protein F2P56_009414 [Juglans regia]